MKNTVIGAVSILVENSNHNSDFEKPRMVNGVLTASDKCLKFYWRHFVKNVFGEDKDQVFLSKTLSEKDSPNTMKGRCESLGIKSRFDLFDYIDNRLFGFTVLGVDKKIEDKMNGPVQIGYGKNISGDNSFSNHAITSQFSSKEGNDQTTIGSETKVSKANYVHYITAHPKKLDRDIILTKKEFEKQKPEISSEDIEKLKFGFSECIGSSIDGSYSSCAKSNTKVGLTVFLTLKEGSLRNVSIDDTIKIGENFRQYDLSDLINVVEGNRDVIDKVEISYNKEVCSIANDIPSGDIYEISSNGYKYKG